MCGVGHRTGGIALEGELMERFGRSVGFGVGVNCGPAVVGNIGCDFRMDLRQSEIP